MKYRRQSGTFHFDQNPFVKNEGIVRYFSEVLLLKELLQTEHQVKSMNNKYYDL